MFDSVAQGFGSNILRRRQMIRMPENPHDKSTIVSIVPKAIHEIKPTIFPSDFHIDAAPAGDFSILVVGMSSWWKETEEGQPDLEIPHSSVQIAESVIKDYSNGLVGCNMADKMPGLFYVPGDYNKKTIQGYVNPKTGDTFKSLMDHAKTRQLAWFKELIHIADVGWARTKGNPLAISDDARLAAEVLGLKNKPWMMDFKAFELVPCKACGELINPAFPVCKHCKAVVDVAKAKELNLTFAQ
jgi:hypothetical protein